jgi:3-oxoacyl-[acyl-carrier protein] reductase
MGIELRGKRAVVTGATRGIGRAVAEALSHEGVSVAICGRSQEGVDEAVAALRNQAGGLVAGLAADISKLPQVEEFFRFVRSELGGLDILVNNAGLAVFKSVAELTPEEWHEVIDLNLNGVFYCCREAMPMLRASGAGSVINISSLAGKNPFAGGAAYNASKFGLNGFSEAMMLDHRHEGIRVSYIMPGSVDTDFSPRSARAAWKIAPEDIADIVMSILKMSDRTLISRVEVRPSRPPK